MSSLVVYQTLTEKAPVLHEQTARRAIKMLWKHERGKRWGPGTMTFGPNNNTIIDQYEVFFDLNGGWKLLIWAVGSRFYKPSYVLEGKVGKVAEYAAEHNWFKRKLKRIRRNQK